MFQAMIDDGDTVISNSWSQCEDQTSSAEAHAIDAVLANAAASGITVLNATGDDGPTASTAAANTIGVPADSPHATAVGGTTPYFGPALSAGEERYWDNRGDTPAGGAAGYGVSRYFDRPAYQNGHTASATAARSPTSRSPPTRTPACSCARPTTAAARTIASGAGRACPRPSPPRSSPTSTSRPGATSAT